MKYELKELLDIIKKTKQDGANILNILGELQVPSIKEASILCKIQELIDEGLIVEKKKNTYIAVEYSKEIVGTISLNKRGFGIVLCNNNFREVFIPPKRINRALDGDTVSVVLVESTKPGNRAEGEVVSIVKRNKTKYVGKLIYDKEKGYGFVVCDNIKIKNDIYVPLDKFNGAKNGQKVVCEIVKWERSDKNPTGIIIESLGNCEDKGIDILSIAKEFGLESEFPINVKKEAMRIDEGIAEDEIVKRKDLRKNLIFTIDGADAKDLDDAVSIKKLENGNYLLGVHIADVSHYVVENMKIDKEAVKRGTSVYLVDRVIPMLPKVLSNGVCSLHPNVDRLTLSIDMEIDKKGDVIKHKIYESVINSKARMVYEDVSDIIENKDEDLINKYSFMKDEIYFSEELAKILRHKRKLRGAIDFDFAEAKIILNENGYPIDIKKYDRRIANKIIEEFMLVANETIAKHFYDLQVPFVYRNHEKPDMEKIIKLEALLNNKGYSVLNNQDQVNAKNFQRVCEEISGLEVEYFISRMMLMSLKEAKYGATMGEHFGLAADYYCHFTSPIRRYPDLQIHRIIKDSVNNRLTQNKIKKYIARVEDVAYSSSKMERYAQEAERQVENLKKAEFMSSRIGEIYEGIISGVISQGMFIQLKNTVEGMVRIETLEDDVYIYEEENYCIKGFSNKKIYNVGDKVSVKVDSVDIDSREINFILDCI